MSIDRNLQFSILNKIAKEYPFSWQHNLELNSDEYLIFATNIHYLKGHGLLSESSTIFKENSNYQGSGRVLLINKPKITEKGLDFLQDDGGLSAILGVVTVRFEADTIRTILQLKVDQSDLSPVDKQKLRGVLQELPAESIKHLSTKIVDVGWDNLGSLMSLIQSSLF